MMSTITIAVTVSMIVMCQFAVRQTCVCFALRIMPLDRSRSSPFHQSQNPVVAVPIDAIAPAMIVYVAATNASCAPEPLRITDSRSKAAARTYAATGMSVSGGCDGLAAQPRVPLKRRPRIVSAGRIENNLAMDSDLPEVDGTATACPIGLAPCGAVRAASAN